MLHIDVLPRAALVAWLGPLGRSDGVAAPWAAAANWRAIPSPLAGADANGSTPSRHSDAAHRHSFRTLSYSRVHLRGRPPHRAGSRRKTTTPIILIVDCGMSMSARGDHDLRFREVFARADAALRSQFGSAPVDLLFIPSGRVTRTDFEGCKNVIEQTPPTAVDTDETLGATIKQQLAQTTGPVIVISDKALPQTNRRLVEIPPERAIKDVGIVKFAARATYIPGDGAGQKPVVAGDCQSDCRCRRCARFDRKLPCRSGAGHATISSMCQNRATSCRPSCGLRMICRQTIGPGWFAKGVRQRSRRRPRSLRNYVE